MDRVIAALGVLLSLAPIGRAEPQAPLPVQQGFVVRDGGVRLHYEVRGRGPDTLVVLHGGPGLSSAYFGPDLDILARNHALIFYDQRGGGRSTVLTDSARLRMADHIGDLEAVRRHFKLDRMTILGHSWGAGLAAHYAGAHPAGTARLILLASIPPRQMPYMQQFGRALRAWMDSATAARVATLAAARRDASDPAAACRAYWSVFIRGYFPDPMDPAGLARMKGDVCDAPPDAIRNTGVVSASVLGPFGAWDWRNDFREVQVPVLVIHGDKDPIPAVSATEWQAAFPQATLVLLENAGHFPYLDQPAAFLRAIEAFLSTGTGIESVIAGRAASFSAAVVRASAAGWARAEVRELAEMYTVETIVFPPRGEPIRGREAVERYWTRSPERRILAHRVRPERIDVSTDLVVEHGKFHITSQLGSAASVTDSATYISAWRRDRDGVWRKHLDSWW